MIATPTPIRAQQAAIDRWGLTESDWRTLSGSALLERAHADDRQAEIMQAVDAGDNAATILAGHAISGGLWAKPDDLKGCEFARRAAAAKNPRGELLAAVCLNVGVGVARDSIMARTRLRALAQSMPAAEASLGVILLAASASGSTEEREAVRLLRSAAERGSDLAMGHLGDVARTGRSEPKDLARAVTLYRKAAELGNVSARRVLGGMLIDGKETTRDIVEGSDLLTNAARQGDTEAMFQLGYFLQRTDAERPDPESALLLFQKAAERGHVRGMEFYGEALRDGIGTPPDPVAALKWFAAAGDAGSSFGNFAAGSMLDRGKPGVPRDTAAAERYYLRAAAMGEAGAMNNLAIILEDRGDLKNAKAWYEKAAAAGSSNARISLAALERDLEIKASGVQVTNAAANQPGNGVMTSANGSPTALAILKISDAANAIHYRLRTTDRPGELVAYSIFGGELHRFQRNVENVSCQRLKSGAHRCSYDMIQGMKYSQDRSWSGLAGAMQVAMNNWLYGATQRKRWTYDFTLTRNGWQSAGLSENIKNTANQARAAAARQSYPALSSGPSDLDRRLAEEQRTRDNMKDWFEVGR